MELISWWSKREAGWRSIWRRNPAGRKFIHRPRATTRGRLFLCVRLSQVETERQAEKTTSNTTSGAPTRSPLAGLGSDPRGLLGDFRLLLMLFIGLRLALMLVYQQLLV